MHRYTLWYVGVTACVLFYMSTCGREYMTTYLQEYIFACVHSHMATCGIFVSTFSRVFNILSHVCMLAYVNVDMYT